MKYLPTLDLWHPAIASAVHTGQIRLQAGQWIKCGTEHKSRLIRGTSRGASVWACHWQGSGSATHAKWRAGIAAVRQSRAVQMWLALPRETRGPRPELDAAPARKAVQLRLSLSR